MNKKLLVRAVLVFLFGIVVAKFGLPMSSSQVESNVDNVLSEVSIQELSESRQVLFVTDGDTFTVKLGETEGIVRVLGINAPETKHSSRGAECFGAEASTYAKQLLVGATVKLQSDPTQSVKDKYGRLLAYVELEDGRDFGQVMIVDGYAYEYTFKGVSYEKQQVYKDSQVQAAEEGAGLWSVCE